jgi:hypothetical protein
VPMEAKITMTAIPRTMNSGINRFMGCEYPGTFATEEGEVERPRFHNIPNCRATR